MVGRHHYNAAIAVDHRQDFQVCIVRGCVFKHVGTRARREYAFQPVIDPVAKLGLAGGGIDLSEFLVGSKIPVVESAHTRLAKLRKNIRTPCRWNRDHP